MKISVCTDIVFRGMPTSQAIRAAVSCGIGAIEFWSWWDKDISDIKRASDETGVKIAALCTKQVSLTDSSVRSDYVTGLTETIAVAKNLGCKRIISQLGNDLGISSLTQRQSIIDGLRQCAPFLEEAGLTLVIEPLNTRVDHIGYYLWSSEEGAAIIDAVASANIKLLFDFYHQQIMEGDVIRRSTAIIDKIGHIHVAGNPGRHELDNGELNYDRIFTELHDKGYRDYVGFEYVPIKEPEAGLREWTKKGYF